MNKEEKDFELMDAGRLPLKDILDSYSANPVHERNKEDQPTHFNKKSIFSMNYLKQPANAIVPYTGDEPSDDGIVIKGDDWLLYAENDEEADIDHHRQEHYLWGQHAH